MFGQAPVIHLRVLGSADLRAPDGSAVLSVLSQPKRLTLLTYLATKARGGFVRRETLVALFWSDSEPERGRTALRSALTYLRRSLGDGVVVTRGDLEVGLDPGSLRCDATDFLELIEKGDQESAWELYTGDFLEGIQFSGSTSLERWIEDERSRLLRSAVEIAADLAKRAEREGDSESALRWTRESLSLDPISDGATRRLMRLLAQTGQPRAAIEAYDTFARRLAEDLDQEPAADTRALVQSIRSAPSVLASAPQAAPVVVSGPQAAPVAASARPATPVRLAAGVRTRRRAGDKLVPSKDRQVLFGASALALAGFVAVLASWGLLRPRLLAPVLRYSVVMAAGEEMPVDQSGRRLALSPDGSHLVYVGGPQRELRVRRRDQLNAPPLPGTAGATSPFFSPDGEHVGFFTRGELKIASLDGRPVVEVTRSIGVDGAAWGSDGWLYATAEGFGGLVRLRPASSAASETFTTLNAEDGETDHIWPAVLPGGAGVLFTVQYGAAQKHSRIAVTDPGGGRHRVLLDGLYARYSASGHLLYAAHDSSLRVAPFDMEKLELTGSPTVVREGLRLGFRGAADVAVSATGSLVYVAGVGRDVRELLWVTRDGATEVVDPAWHASFQNPTLSPDGSKIAVNIGDRYQEGGLQVWVKDLETGSRYRLTDDGAVNGYPSWTPDSEAVTYHSDATQPIGLWTKSAEGGTNAVQQLRREHNIAESLWSPDGRWLVYRTWNVSGASGGTAGAGDILAIMPDTDMDPISLSTGPDPELSPSLSSDGRWLAFTTTREPPAQVYVVPFPDAEDHRWSVSPDGGSEPAWSPGTDELFYRDRRTGSMVAVEVGTTPMFSVGTRTDLFDARPYLALGVHQQYSVSPDGQRFLMIRAVASGDPGDLIMVENWFQDLGKIFGTN